MFTIFWRPKPRFHEDQVVSVPDKNESAATYYLQIQSLEWVRQSGYVHWDWFYEGRLFKAQGSKLSLVAENVSYREDKLGNPLW